MGGKAPSEKKGAPSDTGSKAKEAGTPGRGRGRGARDEPESPEPRGRGRGGPRRPGVDRSPTIERLADAKRKSQMS